VQALLADMRREWAELDTRIEALDRAFVETARGPAPARRLATVPGIGALNATALMAAVGEAEDFAHGRDLAAWLGVRSVTRTDRVPHSTAAADDHGGQARLGGSSQARQCLSPDAADSWRPRGASRPRPGQHAARHVAARRAGPGARQRRRRRADYDRHAGVSG